MREHSYTNIRSMVHQYLIKLVWYLVLALKDYLP